MKVIRESQDNYEARLYTVDLDSGMESVKNISYGSDLSKVLDDTYNYIKENGHEDDIKHDGNIWLSSAYIKIRQNGKPLTFEFTRPRTGKKGSSFDQVMNTNHVQMLKDKYLNESLNEDVNESSDLDKLVELGIIDLEDVDDIIINGSLTLSISKDGNILFYTIE